MRGPTNAPDTFNRPRDRGRRKGPGGRAKRLQKTGISNPPVGAGPRVPLLRLFMGVTEVAETEGAKTEEDFRVLGF